MAWSPLNRFEVQNHDCYGLVYYIARETWQPPVKIPIPLTSVSVNASVVHAVAQVEITQVYVNKEAQPIEAIYYFPVNPDGAVTHFQAELDGKVIKGTVKPKEEAKQDYNNAVANQTTAFLGEETKADIFKVKVGYLKPGAVTKVITGYVTEVKNEPGSNAIRFYIPTTIAPRYVSPSEHSNSANDIKAMQYSTNSPAPLSMTVVVSLQGGIKSINSPTHEVKVGKAESIPENEIWHKAIVEMAGVITEMDRDFVLNIIPEEIHEPRLYSEKTEDGSTAMMLHLVPSFKLDEQKTELIFVLDRSGSMKGRSIELARRALLLFLHSMPADCYFNVVGFGSSYQFLFPSQNFNFGTISVKYDSYTLRNAVEHATYVQADLGGTEILEPLREIFRRPGVGGYLRQIFVLTDGCVSNTDGVLGIVQANAHKARVFSLGIGDGASHQLVEGLAKAGGGTSAFVTYNEGIEKKVLNQLKNGLQPSLTDIELEWEGLSSAPPGKKPQPVLNKEKTLLGYNKPIHPVEPEEGISGNKQSPQKIPPVYDGSQLLVFGLFKDDCPKSLLIKAQSPDGPLTVKVEHSSANDVGKTKMLHHLAAIKLIRELELEVAGLHYQGFMDVDQKEERLKKEIIEISCQNGITSRYTSFVAVYECGEEQPVEYSKMETRQVPTQDAHRWYNLGQFRAVPFSYGSIRRNRRCESSNNAYSKSKRRERECSQERQRSLEREPRREWSKIAGLWNPAMVHEPSTSSQSLFGGGSSVCSSTQLQSQQNQPANFIFDNLRSGLHPGNLQMTSSQFSFDSNLHSLSAGSTFTFGVPQQQQMMQKIEMQQPKRQNAQIMEQLQNQTGTFGSDAFSTLSTSDSSSNFSFVLPSQVPQSVETTPAFSFGAPQCATGPASGTGTLFGAPPPQPQHQGNTSGFLNSTSPEFYQPAFCTSQAFSGQSPLLNLVRLQSFDGSYCLEDKLAAILGKPVDDFKRVAAQNNLQETVLATALAICFFQVKLNNEKDVWELIAKKARKWLASVVGDKNVDALINGSKSLLEA